MLKRNTLDYKLLLFLTIFAMATFGQDTSKFNIRLKFHPVALIAINRPTVLGSIEIKYNKMALDLAYGQQYGFNLSSNPDTQRVRNFGNQYRVDLRYYFKALKVIEATVPFIGIGYCKLYTQRNLTQDWFSGYVFEPSLAFIDNIHVYYINYGACHYFGRLIAEGAVSGGIRFRTQESVYANKIVYDTATRTFPHLSFSLRIGYMLTCKQRGQVKSHSN